MLPTFVIGLREGLEAALIVGIVAAFLKQRGRRDLLRLVWVGVAVAMLICLAVGVGLKVLAADLPQRQQEGLETVVGAIAVAMVTYMVVWMRRHSRDLKKQLEGAAGSALESGSGLALVAMAFLAVFREGFETAVFLVAAFNSSADPGQAGVGVVLGIALAMALGYGIYRGGVRINLSRFFRATGFVLVLVAAGLVVSALHTAHEAGWLTIGQQRTVDLSWLVQPGSVQSSLLTGVLGLQPRPVTAELIGWLVYLIPLGLYVAWPPGRAIAHRTIARVAAAGTVVAVLAGVLLTVLAPDRPGPVRAQQLETTITGTRLGEPLTIGPGNQRLSLTRSGSTARITGTIGTTPIEGSATATGTTTVAGVAATRWSAPAGRVGTNSGLPSTLTLDRVRAINGGRLPVGFNAAQDTGDLPATYRADRTVTVLADASSGRILSATMTTTWVATVTLAVGPIAVGAARTEKVVTASSATAAQAALVRSADRDRSNRSLMLGWATAAWVLAVLGALMTAGALAGARRRGGQDPAPVVADTRAASKVA